eukprot:2732980-Rhodomonas_salina.1
MKAVAEEIGYHPTLLSYAFAMRCPGTETGYAATSGCEAGTDLGRATTQCPGTDASYACYATVLVLTEGYGTTQFPGTDIGYAATRSREELLRFKKSSGAYAKAQITCQ